MSKFLLRFSNNDMWLLQEMYKDHDNQHVNQGRVETLATR